uniref:Uncharacterized protein n=1 Tax=Chenopodium quinoa TaxID=63459 RepID=A0A803L0T2_CHEQI
MKHPKVTNISNNVTRSLDEHEGYFSYILSPFKKIFHKKEPLDRAELATKHGDRKKCEGDINCEAEFFIRQKRKMLELSKTMPVVPD